MSWRVFVFLCGQYTSFCKRVNDLTKHDLTKHICGSLKNVPLYSHGLVLWRGGNERIRYFGKARRIIFRTSASHSSRCWSVLVTMVSNVRRSKFFSPHRPKMQFFQIV